MTSRSALLLASLGALSFSLSCRNLDRFDTRGEAAFCGDLVSGPSFHDVFIPTGQPAVLRMKLTLDTSQISSFAENKGAFPGVLTSNDIDTGLCSAGGQALFESSPLRAIPQVDHDTISTMTFGEGHDEDFFGWTDSTCQGTMLAVVSLMAPTVYHRLRWRERNKERMLRAANLSTILGMSMLAVAMTSGVFLVVDAVVNQTWAIVMTVATAATFLILWLVVPLSGPYRRWDEHVPTGDTTERSSTRR